MGYNSRLACTSVPTDNVAKRCPARCQGWGREFESLRPLQIPYRKQGATEHGPSVACASWIVVSTWCPPGSNHVSVSRMPASVASGSCGGLAAATGSARCPEWPLDARAVLTPGRPHQRGDVALSRPWECPLPGSAVAGTGPDASASTSPDPCYID